MTEISDSMKFEILFRIADRDKSGVLSLFELQWLTRARTGATSQDEVVKKFWVPTCKACKCDPDKGITRQGFAIMYSTDSFDVNKDFAAIDKITGGELTKIARNVTEEGKKIAGEIMKTGDGIILKLKGVFTYIFFLMSGGKDILTPGDYEKVAKMLELPATLKEYCSKAPDDIKVDPDNFDAVMYVRMNCAQFEALDEDTLKSIQNDVQASVKKVAGKLCLRSQIVKYVGQLRAKGEMYTENHAKKLCTLVGLQLGCEGTSFAGDYKTKGLYAYKSGKYAGMAFFGNGGDAESQHAKCDLPKYRPLL